MESPLDLVAFLTRSENRVETLLALADGPATRPDLQDETGVARATLSRILADFRRRDLATRDGHEYAATPLGQLLAAELTSLFASIDATRARLTVAEWLPFDDLGIEFADLADAAVTLPSPADPMAPVKRAAVAIEDATLVRGFCYSVVHAPILAEVRNVTERGHRFVGVIAAGVFEVVAADPALADRVRSLVDDGRAELYVYEGAIEPQLILADGTTMFLVTDGTGAIRGLVEIRDESVLPWAEATVEALVRESDPLDAAAVDELLAP